MNNKQKLMERSVIPKPKYLSPEWHDSRRTQDGRFVFGASETPALMGCDPFRTVVDMCIRKVRPELPSDETPATKRGHILEPVLLEYAGSEYKVEVTKPKVMFRRDRLISTLDGLVQNDDGVPTFVVEAKTTTAYSINEAIPASYFWQVQAQMECVGVDFGVVVCLDRHQHFGFWEVEYDAEAIERLHYRADEIGKILDTDTLHENRDILFTSQQVQNLFPEPAGEVELTADEYALLDLYKHAVEDAKDYEKRAQALKDSIANILRGNEIGNYDGRKVVSYKRQTRKGGFDMNSFTKQEPEMAEQVLAKYQKPANAFRVLRMHI